MREKRRKTEVFWMRNYNSGNSIKNKGDKHDFVRADKLVYANFVDKSLDAMDDSWDLEHIDGNPNNCKVTNLKLKK